MLKYIVLRITQNTAKQVENLSGPFGVSNTSLAINVNNTIIEWGERREWWLWRTCHGHKKAKNKRGRHTEENF